MSSVYAPTPRRISLMADAPQKGDLGIPSEGRREAYVEGNLKIIHALECNGEVMSLRFSPDGNWLTAGLSNGLIKVYSPDTGQCLFSLSDDDTVRSNLPATSLRFRPAADDARPEARSILIATYASGMIKFWHVTSQKCLHTTTESRQVLCSAFNLGGSKLVVSGSEPHINLYDVQTKQLLRTMESSDSRDVMNGHRTRVFAVQYHPNFQHTFISGGWDDTLQFWDDRQKHAVRKLFGPHICGDSLDIDPVHNHILTGSWRKDNALEIWDFQSGEKIKNIPQDPMSGSLMYCAQWLGKESMVCGGTDHHMARVIDRGTLNTVGQLVDLQQGVCCVDNDRQGIKPRVAVGSGRRIYILKVEKKQT